VPVLIAIKLLAGNALSAVWRFLKGASAWQLIALGLAGLCIILWFQRNDARSDAARWQKQDAAHVAELQRISTKKNEQGRTSEKTVTQVVQGQDRVRTVVKTIHDAPNPPDCRTPGLSNLRNVL
jgi:hypothetical protein